MVYCDIKKAKKFATDPGSPIHVLYRNVAKEDGSIVLEESGQENTDDIIASQAESCDIHTVLNRFRNGDLNALNVRKGMYGDFTEMPKTFAEALQIQIDAKRAFESLGPDARKRFDNDVNKFLATAGTDEWYEKLTPADQLDKDEVNEGDSE